MKPAIVLIVLPAVLILSFLVLSSPDSKMLDPKSGENGVLRVVAANLNYQNGKARDVTNTLLGTDFDIAILTEWTGRNAFLEDFRKAGYQIGLNEPRDGTHGICVLIKEGIPSSSGLLKSPVKGPCRLPFSTSRIKINGMYLTIIGAHAPPPVPSCRDSNLPTIRAMAGWIEKGRLAGDLGTGISGDPVIIAGDLNLASLSPKVSILTEKGMLDVVAENRKPMPTWTPIPIIPPIIRLDYILAGSKLSLLSAEVLDMPGSDHRLVACDLKVLPEI